MIHRAAKSSQGAKIDEEVTCPFHDMASNQTRSIQQMCYPTIRREAVISYTIGVLKICQEDMVNDIHAWINAKHNR